MKLSKIVMIGSMLLTLAIPATAYAGSINGNEQAVLGIVQGGFEYNGVYYTAAPGYIAKVRSYLAQDDVDLTAQQASEAASEIYANIQTGVTEGYIIPSESIVKESTDSKSDSNALNPKQAQTMKPTAKNTDKVIISTSSGMVEALDEEGKQLFVFDSVIKDTGYELSGVVAVFILFIIGIGLCMILMFKNNLLAHDHES